MGVLKGLKGTTIAEMECEFFSKPSEIKKILESGKAVTTAKDNGAINIWKDDEGFIRCEAMRYYATLDEQRFAKISEVKEWAKKWLLEIQ